MYGNGKSIQKGWRKRVSVYVSGDRLRTVHENLTTNHCYVTQLTVKPQQPSVATVPGSTRVERQTEYRCSFVYFVVSWLAGLSVCVLVLVVGIDGSLCRMFCRANSGKVRFGISTFFVVFFSTEAGRGG